MFRPGANARTDERFLQALPTSNDTKWYTTWRDVHVDTCIKKETISQPKGWSENKGKKEVISTIDNSTRGRSEPPKSDDCSKRGKFGRSCHWFHKYLFHCRCDLYHPCHPSTSIVMRYRTPWSLTSTTKSDILSIITGWLSWYPAHVEQTQFNNEGLDMFVCTLSRSWLVSNWFTNRFGWS